MITLNNFETMLMQYGLHTLNMSSENYISEDSRQPDKWHLAADDFRYVRLHGGQIRQM